MTKKCPYCAEEILEEAVKCKHCMEFLDESKRPVPIAQPPALPVGKPVEEVPWYCKTGSIVLTFMMVPPLAIPLIWLHPKLHLAWKIGLTVATLLVCWGMVRATAALFAKYQEALEMMNGMGGF